MANDRNTFPCQAGHCDCSECQLQMYSRYFILHHLAADFQMKMLAKFFLVMASLEYVQSNGSVCCCLYKYSVSRTYKHPKDTWKSRSHRAFAVKGICQFLINLDKDEHQTGRVAGKNLTMLIKVVVTIMSSYSASFHLCHKMNYHYDCTQECDIQRCFDVSLLLLLCFYFTNHKSVFHLLCHSFKALLWSL